MAARVSATSSELTADAEASRAARVELSFTRAKAQARNVQRVAQDRVLLGSAARTTIPAGYFAGSQRRVGRGVHSRGRSIVMMDAAEHGKGDRLARERW